MSVAENISIVRQKIKEAAIRGGRNPETVKLVAVTKTVEPSIMEEAFNEDVLMFGENRVQELLRKYPVFENRVEWHLIGHLQTNKVKQIIDKTALIHSLDRISLAREISATAQQREITVPVLVQVNISGEESKYGLAPDEVFDFLTEIVTYPGMRVLGLMTIAPLVAVPEETRPVFRGLRQLAQQIRDRKFPGVDMHWLSMGMTNDYEVAVEEGANLVRIGSGIFGPRK